MTHPQLLRRYRVILGLFIVALVLSGVTAFPLVTELSILSSIVGVEDPAEYASYSGLKHWIAYVHHGLVTTNESFPFLAYGTDWLAFGHIVIALFFIGPLIDPVPNAWVLKIGLVACAGVIPLAMIAGPIREIPFYWRLIDCSFGILGAIPLLYCLKLTRKMSVAT